MKWFFQALRKYAVFQGRARRKEFWYFMLFNTLFALVLRLLEVQIAMASFQETGLLSGIYGLLMFLPGFAVKVRRLHDTNHSGWWLLIGLIPIVGAIVLLMWMVRDSDAGANRYGLNPQLDPQEAAAFEQAKDRAGALKLDVQFDHNHLGKNVIFGRGVQLTDDDLATVIPLRPEELYLSRTPLTDAAVAQFEQMSQLRVLDVSHTGMTPAGIQRLRESRADLKVYS